MDKSFKRIFVDEILTETIFNRTLLIFVLNFKLSTFNSPKNQRVETKSKAKFYILLLKIFTTNHDIAFKNVIKGSS